MPKKVKTYQENFISGVRMLMANNPELDTLRKVADHLPVGYMALYKVMDGTNNPTVDLCITLCRKAGYSANWLFLDEGEIYLSDQAGINALMKEVRSMRSMLEGKMPDSAASQRPVTVNKKVNTGKRKAGNKAL